MSMKDLLVTFKGSDPLMFKLDNMDGEKILTSSGFWVNATNDFVNAMKSNFGEYIEVGIKSLDS